MPTSGWTSISCLTLPLVSAFILVWMWRSPSRVSMAPAMGLSNLLAGTRGCGRLPGYGLAFGSRFHSFLASSYFVAASSCDFLTSAEWSFTAAARSRDALISASRASAVFGSPSTRRESSCQLNVPLPVRPVDRVKSAGIVLRFATEPLETGTATTSVRSLFGPGPSGSVEPSGPSGSVSFGGVSLSDGGVSVAAEGPGSVALSGDASVAGTGVPGSVAGVLVPSRGSGTAWVVVPTSGPGDGVPGSVLGWTWMPPAPGWGFWPSVAPPARIGALEVPRGVVVLGLGAAVFGGLLEVGAVVDVVGAGLVVDVGVEGVGPAADGLVVDGPVFGVETAEGAGDAVVPGVDSAGAPVGRTVGVVVSVVGALGVETVGAAASVAGEVVGIGFATEGFDERGPGAGALAVGELSGEEETGTPGSAGVGEA